MPSRRTTARFGSTPAFRARARRCSLRCDALFVPDKLRAALDDEAWLRAMLAAERALAQAPSLGLGGVVAAGGGGVDGLVRGGHSGGNPVEPLVRRLRERSEHVHRGA